VLNGGVDDEEEAEPPLRALPVLLWHRCNGSCEKAPLLPAAPDEDCVCGMAGCQELDGAGTAVAVAEAAAADALLDDGATEVMDAVRE
jgi:hypothetical protein